MIRLRYVVPVKRKPLSQNSWTSPLNVGKQLAEAGDVVEMRVRGAHEPESEGSGFGGLSFLINATVLSPLKLSTTP